MAKALKLDKQQRIASAPLTAIITHQVAFRHHVLELALHEDRCYFIASLVLQSLRPLFKPLCGSMSL